MSVLRWRIQYSLSDGVHLQSLNESNPDRNLDYAKCPSNFQIAKRKVCVLFPEMKRQCFQSKVSKADLQSVLFPLQHNILATEHQ